MGPGTPRLNMPCIDLSTDRLRFYRQIGAEEVTLGSNAPIEGDFTVRYGNFCTPLMMQEEPAPPASSLAGFPCIFDDDMLHMAQVEAIRLAAGGPAVVVAAAAGAVPAAIASKE